jgi:hypothetical protein
MGGAEVMVSGYFSGLALGGRPLPGTLRTRSSVSSGYRASFDIGSIPALTILCLAAKYDIPKASATSWIVIPVIFLLSVFYPKSINCSIHDTFCLTSVKGKLKKNMKKYQNNDTFLLTILLKWRYIYI